MRAHTAFRALAIAALLSCYVTILVGGNVIATGSGLGCPSWPVCTGHELIPPLSGAAAIEFSHRLSAFLLSVLVLAMTVAALVAERRRPTLVRLSLSSLVTVVLEAFLGGVVVDSRLSAAIVIVHLAIATVLFGLLLVLAILGNARELPPRWKEWARRAMGLAEAGARPTPRAPSSEAPGEAGVGP